MSVCSTISNSASITSHTRSTASTRNVITRAATRSVIWFSGSSYFGLVGSSGCGLAAFARNDSGSFARAVALR